MLSILDALYLILIIFSSIIGTLMIIALMRIIKILGPIVEVVEFYKKIKQVFKVYKKIPLLLKEKLKEIFGVKDEE